MQDRPTKRQYYLELAHVVAKRGTCLHRNYGAVIVSNDQIVATGYTGAPRGVTNCTTCLREELKVPKGQNYELCRSVHAEVNAIIHAGRERCLGSIMYLVGIERNSEAILSDLPCNMCQRVIQNAGIETIVTYNYSLYVKMNKVLEYITEECQ